MNDPIASLLSDPAHLVQQGLPPDTTLIPVLRYPPGGCPQVKNSHARVVAFSLIDRIDIERVLAFRWYLFQPKPHLSYAGRMSKIDGRPAYIFLHRFILDLPPGNKLDVDHRNRIGLDNRQSNLRQTTRAQNLQNQRHRIGVTSKYRGVSWDKIWNRWVACVYINKRRVLYRGFKTETEAADAAREARLKYMPFTEEDL